MRRCEEKALFPKCSLVDAAAEDRNVKKQGRIEERRNRAIKESKP